MSCSLFKIFGSHVSRCVITARHRQSESISFFDWWVSIQYQRSIRIPVYWALSRFSATILLVPLFLKFQPGRAAVISGNRGNLGFEMVLSFRRTGLNLPFTAVMIALSRSTMAAMNNTTVIWRSALKAPLFTRKGRCRS